MSKVRVLWSKDAYCFTSGRYGEFDSRWCELEDLLVNDLVKHHFRKDSSYTILELVSQMVCAVRV